ncbi:MAG TPA: Tex family protein [Ktedonobacterales bacterium]
MTTPDSLPESLATETLARTLAIELSIRPGQAQHTLELLDDGNTVPFIARYRKEATGNLDEVQIQAVGDRAEAMRQLHARKRDVLRLIGEQGKLTDTLAQAIMGATTLTAVDDLYLPYRPKRKTRASMARERGLQPLAEMILRQERLAGAPAEALAHAADPFVSVELGVESAAAALAGARDICAEIICEDAGVRSGVRKLFASTAELRARLAISEEEAKAKDPRGVYQLYYDFAEPVRNAVPHRILALNRAEREDVLRVAVDLDFEDAEPEMSRAYRPDNRSPFYAELNTAIQEGYRRLLAPAIEREVRAQLTAMAEEHAIGTFATNLRNLLLQPPLLGRRVLGLDPGFRTGCKVAVISETGAPIASTTVYPHPPQSKADEAKATLAALIVKHDISVIAIGNGTASRETEQLVASLLADLHRAKQGSSELGYVMVNEAGASVYSASEIARQEFPDLDATERGTISIARRLQDPLAELVKIDPKSIGVGLYQHDVDQRALGTALDRVVVSCVNYAGVNVNTASASLLKHVSGVSARVADNIVTWRAKNGPFRRREQLKKVAGLGPATFVQAAGFIRIPDGDEPLDDTFIHPESYTAARELLLRLPGAQTHERVADRVRLWRQQVSKSGQAAQLTRTAQELNVGELTLLDILENLEKPGLDPRQSLPQLLLRQDVLKMEDLRPGMLLQGTVRNVVDFGAFVDIGVKQDGLVHISEMADHYVKDPHTVLAVGQVLQVRVIGVDAARGRIQLSLRSVS